jgi:thiol-disulfide isomerase/thioredoxin
MIDNARTVVRRAFVVSGFSRTVAVRLLWMGVILCPAILAAADRARDLQLRDVDGGNVKPFASGAQASVAFFVATDCPVSNAYAPEIQRVCREYRGRGVGCSLIYEDVEIANGGPSLRQQVRGHLTDYKFAGIPAAIDGDRAAAAVGKATITPTAVVVDRGGAIRYRGRIDNLYVALGKTRQQVTSHDLRDALDAVLAGHPVLHPETESIGCFITDPALLRTHSHE